MKAYLVAVNLLVQVHHRAESAIVDALNGTMPPDMRKHIGSNSTLIDWAIADHASGQPAVMNVSIYIDEPSPSFDAAVNAAIADGITVCVLAGNGTANNGVDLVDNGFVESADNSLWTAATFTTGATPREHGVVANGLYERDRFAVRFWDQPTSMVKQEKVWERLRRVDPTAKTALLFLRKIGSPTAITSSIR